MPERTHAGTLHEILEREEALNRLLPARQLRASPGAEMRAAEAVWQDAVWAEAERIGPAPLDEETRRFCLRFAQRPVFLLGVHRSGTTLAHDLLDGHAQLSVLPAEGSYLTTHRAKIEAHPPADRARVYGKLWLERLVKPIHQPPYWMLGRSTETRSPYVEFARRFLTFWPLMETEFGQKTILWPFLAIVLAYALSVDRLHPGIRWWVEKTPTHEAFLDVLRRDFPSARFIHVVRDPVAVYSSRKRIDEQVSGRFRAARQVLQELERSFRIALEEQQKGKDASHCLLRYEDVLADPEREMRRVAAHLEIDWEESLLRPTSAGIPTHPNSSFTGDMPAGAISHATGGDAHLSQNEREAIAACVGGLARQLGYTVEEVAPLRRWAFQTLTHIKKIDGS